MKITFRGWRREVYPHIHEVAPVISWTASRPGAPLKWSSPLQANGKLTKLALNGDFRIEMQFTESDLKNWLVAFAQADPERAVELMHDVQLKTLRSLIKRLPTK